MTTLLTCNKFSVVRHEVSGRDGLPHLREAVVHPGSVAILPLLDDGRVVLIRNFRHAIGRELLEIPAGTLDQPGESAEAAAARELEEETGYRASRLSALCRFHPSPGVLTEFIRVFVATGLQATRQRLDATEQIRVEQLGLADALERVRAGEIVDGKTIIALLYWDRHRGGMRT